MCPRRFVDQDDHLVSTLTVEESLMYSAQLRLPDVVPDGMHCPGDTDLFLTISSELENLFSLHSKFP